MPAQARVESQCEGNARYVTLVFKLLSLHEATDKTLKGFQRLFHIVHRHTLAC